MSYVLLFFSAFISATLFPFSSEAMLFALIQAGYSPWTLFWVALAGNTLGSGLNYVLGFYLQQFKDRPWFYLKPERLQKFEHLFQRYGIWGLLFSWVPVVGDSLTFFAGVVRVNFMLFFVLVALGKAGRYAVILCLAV